MAPLSAQTASNACNRERVNALSDAELGAWRGFRPKDLGDSTAALRTAGQWGNAAELLRVTYLAPDATAGRRAPGTLQVDPSIRATLDAQADSLRAEVIEEEVRRGARNLGRVTIARFDTRFDNGDFLVFEGRGPAILLTSAMAVETLRSICWYAMAAKDLATWFGAPGRDSLVVALTALREQWDWFAYESYAQLPHEYLINGWIPRPRLQPPTFQLILAHPSVGGLMESAKLTRLRGYRAHEAALVETGGFLWYPARKQTYMGVSHLLSFTDAGSPSQGFMLHLNPRFKFGMVWHASDGTSGSRRGFLVSVDLYRHVVSTSQRTAGIVRSARAAATSCTSRVSECVKVFKPSGQP